MAQLSSQDRGCDGRQTRGREAGTCACLSPAARSYHEMTFSSSTTMETHKETWTKDRESRSQIPTLSLKKELKILFQNVTTFSSISSHHSNISNDFVPWRKEKHCLHVDLSWPWALALSLSDIFAGDSVLKGIEKKRRGKDRGKQRRKWSYILVIGRVKLQSIDFSYGSTCVYLHVNLTSLDNCWEGQRNKWMKTGKKNCKQVELNVSLRSSNEW